MVGAESIGFVGGILERERGNLFRKKDEKVQLLKRLSEMRSHHMALSRE